MDTDDIKLIEDYIKGNDDAFKKIVYKYSTQIYNFVYYLGAKEETDDIVQESFVKIWKNIKKYDNKKSFKSWIFSIARNTTIDWLRKKKPFLFSEFENEDGTNYIFDNLSSEDIPADEFLSNIEDSQKISEIIEKLPLKDREILLLYYSTNQTFKEISEDLKEPLNTIKSRHKRALDKVRKKIEELKSSF